LLLPLLVCSGALLQEGRRAMLARAALLLCALRLTTALQPPWKSSTHASTRQRVLRAEEDAMSAARMLLGRAPPGEAAAATNVTKLSAVGDLEALTGVLFVSAPTCRACRAVEPAFSRYAASSDAGAFYKAVVGRDRSIAEYLGVAKAPAFCLLNDGRVERTLATSSKTELRAFLDKAVVFKPKLGSRVKNAVKGAFRGGGGAPPLTDI
jgi:thioredoxin-like negative regulator of GroEL